MWSCNNIWMPVTWWCWIVRLIRGCYRFVWLIRGCYRFVWLIRGCYRFVWLIRGCYRVVWLIRGCYRFVWLIRGCYRFVWLIWGCYRFVWLIRGCYRVVWLIRGCYRFVWLIRGRYRFVWLIRGCYRFVRLIRGCYRCYRFVRLIRGVEDFIDLFCCSDGWRVPSLRPLETLHNALTLRQLEIFIKSLTENPFKTPAPSSSLGTPICVTPCSSQAPSTNLVLPATAGQSQFKIFFNSKFIFHYHVSFNHSIWYGGRIQLLLKRLPDFSVSSLIRAGWHQEEHPVTKTLF